jgi:acyl dehydratase
LKEVEFNKSVDDWFEKLIKRKGETIKPPVGSWPPDFNVGLHASINNENITTDVIRHYAEATGDRNPLWRDEDYARKTIWGGIIAPPTITDAIAVSWPTKRGKLSELNFDMNGLPAGTKRQFFNVIRPGDKYKVTDTFVDLVEKKPKQEGPVRLFVETNRRSYINQKDETVAAVDCRMVHLATPLPDDPSGTPVFSGGDRARYILKDHERDAIYKYYDTETRRGSNTLHWKDVDVGAKIPELTVGPVTTWHTASWLAALAGYALAFDMEWEITKADFKFAWFDRKWNVWKCGGEGHLCDGSGHASYSGGHAFAYGSQIEGLICRSIHNWIGDAGFLKEMDFAFRSIPILGDAYTIMGTVTKKYIEGDEHLVDLEMHCQNQEGLILVPGTARVKLQA